MGWARGLRQRRSIHQPRVGATQERLPWGPANKRPNPNGVASGRTHGNTTPLGLGAFWMASHGSARRATLGWLMEALRALQPARRNGGLGKSDGDYFGGVGCNSRALRSPSTRCSGIRHRGPKPSRAPESGAVWAKRPNPCQPRATPWVWSKHRSSPEGAAQN